MIRLLLIDDEVAIAKAMRRTLEKHEVTVTVADDAESGLARLATDHEAFDVVLLDVDMPGKSGLAVLAEIKRLGYACPVVMWTADNRALTATAAMHAGAFTYVTKPVVCLDELVATLHSAASFCSLKRHAHALEVQVAHATATPRILGESAEIRGLRDRVHRLAQSDVTVLIHGESGTGKELVARTLHERSARAARPFVAVNCAAIPEALIDSELFGHSKGAFTGAVAARPGMFVEADGGTLFLDEIAELPLAAQTRLLRVLQEREIRPVGGDGVRTVDVRIIAATHAGLAERVDSKQFRADLFFRLNVANVELPPLRARTLDLPLLVAHLLAKHSGARRVHVTPAALAVLETSPWPGNVRELENALLYGLALTSKDVIDVNDLPASLTAAAPAVLVARPQVFPDDPAWSEVSLAEAKKRAIDDFERRYVTGVLTRSGGNLNAAARISGLDRSNFRRVLIRIGIEPERFRDL